MDRGLEWYKRDPRAMIDAKRAANDSQGMTMAQAAIYDLVTDLIYEGAGQTPNNPKYFASHFFDMSTRAARLAVEFLVDSGKLEINDRGFLSNSRAKLEAKARQTTSKVRAKAGKKGGINSAKAREKSNKNNEPPQANASSKIQPEKRREEKRIKREIISPQKNENSHSLPLFADQAKSIPKSDPVVDALAKVPGLSLEAISDYLKFRKGTRAKGTTERAAGMIAKELIEVHQRGGDVEQALTVAQVQGWQGFKADWYFNNRGTLQNGQQHHNSPTANGRGMAGTEVTAEITDRAARLTNRAKAQRGDNRDPRGGFS